MMREDEIWFGGGEREKMMINGKRGRGGVRVGERRDRGVGYVKGGDFGFGGVYVSGKVRVGGLNGGVLEYVEVGVGG